jgi:hypothetical protein
VADVRFEFDEGEFQHTEDRSEQIVESYRTFVRPWMRAAITPVTASWLQWFHPARLPRVAWSDRINPALGALPEAARVVRENRRQVRADNPWLEVERRNVELLEQSIAAWTKARDEWAEALFKLLPR